MHRLVVNKGMENGGREAAPKRVADKKMITPPEKRKDMNHLNNQHGRMMNQKPENNKFQNKNSNEKKDNKR